MSTTHTDDPVRGPWTYERMAAMTPEDTVRREIIDGWLYIDGQLVDDPFAEVAAESSSVSHGDAVRELLIALASFRATVRGQVYTAPMDVQFGDVVLQPDVFWLERQPDRDTRPITAVPLLTIEVSSPSTRGHDLVRKRRVYEQAGVGEYWFVDLDADRFEVYQRAGGADAYDSPRLIPRGSTVDSRALPGLVVAVDDILGPPPTPGAGS